jgi:hypothetical protein
MKYCMYEVADFLHKYFFSSLMSSVTVFGTSFLLFSDYTYIHHCSPLALTQSAVPEDTYLRLQPVQSRQHIRTVNLLKLALRLEWPALIRLIGKKTRQFSSKSRKHGDEPIL